MVRCEDRILHWDNPNQNPSVLNDSDFKVKSLGLIHSDYISDNDLHNKVNKMKSDKTSYLKLIESQHWKQRENKTFLPMSKA